MWESYVTTLGTCLAAGATVPEIVNTFKLGGENVRKTSMVFLLVRILGFILLTSASVASLLSNYSDVVLMHTLLFVWLIAFYAVYIVFKLRLPAKAS